MTSTAELSSPASAQVGLTHGIQDHDYTLDDKYGRTEGRIYLSGVQALVRLPMMQHLRDVAAGLGSAVIPYLTVPFERSALRCGLLGDSWRLATHDGQGLADRIVSLVVRRPVPAALVLVVVIALVFTGLLAVGPPTQWFA